MDGALHITLSSHNLMPALKTHCRQKHLCLGIQEIIYLLFHYASLHSGKNKWTIKWKPVSKPNLNSLIIGCFEKPSCPVGKKYTSKEKKSTKFIFEQILNTVFWGYFWKLIPAVTDLKNKNKNMSSRHSPFYKGTIHILGFHMTSPKFKLRNYRFFWVSTFMWY